MYVKYAGKKQGRLSVLQNENVEYVRTDQYIVIGECDDLKR